MTFEFLTMLNEDLRNIQLLVLLHALSDEELCMLVYDLLLHVCGV
jgi:hypothetical protein